MSTPNQKIEYPFSCAPTVEIAENNGSKTTLEQTLALLRWVDQCQGGGMTVVCCKTLADNLDKFLRESDSILSPIPNLKHKLEDFLRFLETAKDEAERESKDQVFVDNSKILPIVQELDKVIDEIK